MSIRNDVLEYNELHLEGVYEIVDVYLERYKYKEKRFVVFPMKARAGEKLMFLYVNFYQGASHHSLGKVFYSNAVGKIEVLKNNTSSIQITTDDNQWVLARVM